MFERFTDRARKVMALANQEAQRFHHEYIGTEHILLGLIKEGTGVGAVVLKDSGVDLQRIRDQVELMVKSGPEAVPMSKLPHTPLAKNAIEQAIIAARDLNHSYVGTEHILLGLLAVQGGIAYKVLDNLGVKPDQARQRVVAIVGSSPAGAGTAAPGQEMPLSPRCERVLGHARSEARQLGSPQVEQAHLLLAMLRLGGDVTGWILREHGLTYENILELLRHQARGPAGEVVLPAEQVATSQPPAAAFIEDEEVPSYYAPGSLTGFTDRARQVIALANLETQRFNHEHIGTEHILLGLIKEGGVGGTVLKRMNVDLRKVRLEVEKMIRRGPKQHPMGPLPYSPHAKHVVELAKEEARDLKHNYVGTEHLLLGIVREREGLAAKVLENIGLKLEDIRHEVLCLLGALPPGERHPEPPPRKRWWQWWR